MTLELPHDIAAEVGVIGTLLQTPDMRYLAPYLQADHFDAPENKVLYWAITGLTDSGVKTVDAFNISKVIAENPSIQKLWSSIELPPLIELLDKYAIAARTTEQEYSALVSRLLVTSYRRRAYHLTTKLAQRCLEQDNRSIADLHGELCNRLSDLSEKYMMAQPSMRIGDVIDQEWNSIVQLRNGAFVGMPSRYPIVNRYFSYRPGELTCIVARPKDGKSLFLMNECLHKAYSGVPCAYFDTEMPTYQQLPRMLAITSGLTINEIISGTYEQDAEKTKQFQTAYEKLKAAPLVHQYNSAWDTNTIMLEARKLKEQRDFRLGFLCFDYIKDTGAREFQTQKLNYALGDFANCLKNKVAGELNIPVLCAAQSAPNEYRAADSDGINKFCTTVCYLMPKTAQQLAKEHGLDAGNYKLAVGYNRIGAALDKEGECMNFIFDKERGRFLQAPYQAISQPQTYEHITERED